MIDLSIEHVSKRYRIRNPESTRGSAFRRIAGRFFAQQHDFWALRDVSLDVPRGETTGIIGHNGAGKSTLMKLLSGITAPTEGEIRIRGRLAALIELGSGFHPELTGRENAFMSGAVLGMRRREVAAKFDQIVEFAGIGDFIDVPVKWYSSGMYVRLGFAIAAHVDVDVLLVDEVLAVGDAAFQSKCFNRIEELRKSGTTIVMITHDLGAIQRLSSRAMLLDHGRVVTIGPTRDVVATYEQMVNNAKAGVPDQPESASPMTIRAIRLLDEEGADVTLTRTGQPLRVQVDFEVTSDLQDPVFDLLFYSTNDGSLQSHCTSAGRDGIDLERGGGSVEFDLPALGLQPGIYTLGVTVTERGASQPCAWQYGRTTLYVEDGMGLRGRFYMPHAFRVLPGEAAKAAVPVLSARSR